MENEYSHSQQFGGMTDANDNPWMLCPFYSVLKTESRTYGMQKSCLLMLHAMTQSFFFCVLLRENDLKTGYVIIYTIVGVICSWICNYLWGYLASKLKDEVDGMVQLSLCFWVYLLTVYVALSVGATIATFSTEAPARKIILVCCIAFQLIDFLIFDAVVVLFADRVLESSQEAYAKIVRFLSLRGFYNTE